MVSGPITVTPSDGVSSWLGDALRNIPLLGGLLGAMGDGVAGVGNLALGIVTFGQSGTLESGVDQVLSGVGTLITVTVTDAAGLALGIAGKAYVTVTDVANILTGGTINFLDRDGVDNYGRPASPSPTGFTGAIIQFASNLPVPAYGFNLGAGWGTRQFGPDAPYLNMADYYSREHDQNMIDREWVRNQYGPTPTGVVPTGPIGSVIVLIGTVPFWVHNGP